MATLRSWSILALGFVAAACATGGGSAPPRTSDEGDGAKPEAPAEPSAFPTEAGGGEQPISDAALGNAEPPPPSAPAAAGPAKDAGRTPAADSSPSRSAESSAPKARGEAKSSRRPLDFDAERPGLGTTWGETRTSHVSNAPFERASQSPFAVSTVRYNDASGIAATMRGASLVDFQTDSAPAAGGAITVRLLDENGTPLPTFVSGGRTLVSGEHGQRYVIELGNRSANRFEAVVTVDGLDVIDGRTGSFAKRGYLVQPFASVTIDGFRQSMDRVAAFRFGSVRGSYAAKKGDDRNVGVIGVALFSERGAQAPWTERELGRRENADPFPGRFASPVAN